MLTLRPLSPWAVTITATAVSTYALDAIATAAGVLLVASHALGGVEHWQALVFLGATYAAWGAGLRANVHANWSLLERTGTSSNALSKAAHDLARLRTASVRARRIATAAGYVGTEIAKEALYYAGAFGAAVLSDSVSSTDAIVFLGGTNLGAAAFEYGLARLTRSVLGRRSPADRAVFGMTRVCTIATLVVLLACTATASAQSDDRPVRLWSFSEVQERVGTVEVEDGSQLGGLLRERFEFGPAAFDFPESLRRGTASGDIFSTTSGRRFAVLAQAPSTTATAPAGTPKGGISHLDQFQSYVKRSRAASLRITISKAIVDAIDANGGLLRSECPSGLSCTPVTGMVRFQARAYAESAGGDFFRVGGVALVSGHQGDWAIQAATLSDSRKPLWNARRFRSDADVEDIGTGSHAITELKAPLPLRVDLSSLRDGELFAVHVSLDAQTVDDRGRESAVMAFIRDPQRLAPALVETAGLKARGAPAFAAPPIEAPAPATCPAGPDPASGTLQLSRAAYVTDETTGVPMVLVTRTGGTAGEASATVTTGAGSAESGSDYTETVTSVRFADGDSSPRLVEIPIHLDEEPEPVETFSVSLADAVCVDLGEQSSAEVTIVDDDSPDDEPAGFTIGGTVGGLEGSGLVLSNQGTQLPVGNGPFTFAGAVADGLPYDVTIATQPSDPDQVCAVTNGAGTVTGADVTDIAVDCAAPTPPSGLDPTFGGDGKVSTVVGRGEAEAVLVQPGGGIITAGRSAVGGDVDFTLTRHDARGALDPGFGAGGIVRTDVGSVTDEALDAALHPDGGFVVAGRTDGPRANRNFGVARYDADGHLEPGFGADGIVTTDFAGQVDQANAVAVQPDGKILVAGHAATRGPLGVDNDFAIARYLADGTLDAGFGGDGTVTTDLGTATDLGRAVVIQRGDGHIVVAGNAGDDVALVRYTADGKLDTTFGADGIILMADPGGQFFANGVALTPEGEILVAGHTLGHGATTDFALARFRADGTQDASFGEGGVVTTDIGGDEDFAEELTVDAEGTIVVVGRATSSTILDLAVTRYESDGTLDPGFGENGIVTADFHGSGEFGQDVAVQADGKIVAAGYTANGADTEFALIRVDP